MYSLPIPYILSYSCRYYPRIASFNTPVSRAGRTLLLCTEMAGLKRDTMPAITTVMFMNLIA